MASKGTILAFTVKVYNYSQHPAFKDFKEEELASLNEEEMISDDSYDDEDDRKSYTSLQEFVKKNSPIAHEQISFNIEE